MLETLLKNCKASTKICVAVNLTANNQWIQTKTVSDWQLEKPDIHKSLAIFLLHAY